MKRSIMLSAICLFAIGCGGSSSTPSTSMPDLNGMIGMRASSLDSEMASSGYRNTGGYKEGSTSYTTWWNASASHCVSVATRDGRVDEIDTIDDGNCL